MRASRFHDGVTALAAAVVLAGAAVVVVLGRGQRASAGQADHAAREGADHAPSLLEALDHGVEARGPGGLRAAGSRGRSRARGASGDGHKGRESEDEEREGRPYRPDRMQGHEPLLVPVHACVSRRAGNLLRLLGARRASSSGLSRAASV
jgi:uncharacterized SAM-binding protein YcdF (DUF218 family)